MRYHAVTMSDAMPYCPPRAPLAKELSDGTAHVGVKIVLTIVLAAIGVAGALIGGFMLAALNPTWDRYRTGTGVHPTDELMLGTSVLAGVAFLAAVAWLWSRGRYNRAVIYATVLSVAIIGATIALGVLADSALSGDSEFVIAGIVFLGFAGLLLMWLFAIRRRGPQGRPPRNAQDGMLDVLCPACGYRMVGLRESRCPECGAQYTLDELLSRQRFYAVRAQPPPLAQAMHATAVTLPPLPTSVDRAAAG
jgi:hypothetical protein